MYLEVHELLTDFLQRRVGLARLTDLVGRFSGVFVLSRALGELFLSQVVTFRGVEKSPGHTTILDTGIEYLL